MQRRWILPLGLLVVALLVGLGLTPWLLRDDRPPKLAIALSESPTRQLNLHPDVPMVIEY